MPQVTIQVDVKHNTNYQVKILESGSKEMPCLVIPVAEIETRIHEILGSAELNTTYVYTDDAYLKEHYPEAYELKKLLFNPKYNQ